MSKKGSFQNFKAEKLSEFYEIEWEGSAMDIKGTIKTTLGVSKSNLFFLSAKHGNLLAFRNYMKKEFFVESVDLEDKLRRFFNDYDDNKGYNIIQCAILHEKFDFVEVIFRYFGNLLDFQARVGQQRKDFANFTTISLISSALNRYRNLSQSQVLERLLTTANYYSSCIAMSRDSMLSDSTVQNSLNVSEFDRERESIVQRTLKEYITVLENSINNHDCNLIGRCLLDLATQIECLKPHRKDSVIIEVVDALKNFSKISDYERRLDILDALKQIVISNIGTSISFQTEEIREKLFNFLLYCDKWCDLEINQSPSMSMKRSLFVRGRYLCNVTSVVLTSQFRFVDEDADFFDKLLAFSNYIGHLANAATLNLQSAVEAIVQTASYLVEKVNRLKAGRLRGLITVVEGFNSALCSANEISVKMDLFRGACSVFERTRDRVVDFNDWLVFYGVLEITVQFAIGNQKSIKVQEEVSSFLLKHLEFLPLAYNRLASNSEIIAIVGTRIWEIIAYLSLFQLDAAVLSQYEILQDKFSAQLSSVSYVKTGYRGKKYGGLWMKLPDHNVRFLYLLLSTTNPLFMDMRQSCLTGSLLIKHVVDSILEKNAYVCAAIDDVFQMDPMHEREQIVMSLASFLVDIFENYESIYLKCNVHFADDLKQHIIPQSSILENGSDKLSCEESVDNESESILIPSPEEEISITLEVDEAQVLQIIKDRELYGPPENFNLQESILLLRYLINSEELEEIPQGLLLIGATAAGKSTLANILAGCDMKYNSEIDQVHVSLNTKVPEQTKIGNQITSCTLKTQLVATNDWVIGDTAGLQDVRGFEFSIANAVNIVRFLTRCRSVRIMLVTSLNDISSLAARNRVAVPVWTQLKSMLGNKFVDALPSILFGFTRKPSSNTNARIQDFYSACKVQQDKVPYVMIPPPSEDDNMEDYAESIRSAINNVQPISDCASFVNVALLQDTVGYLRAILKALLNIQLLLDSEMFQEVSDRFKLLLNLTFIRSDIIDEGIDKFRSRLYDFFKTIESHVNKVLSGKASRSGCRKLKKYIQTLEKSIILDACFSEPYVASTNRDKIANDIRDKEFSNQRDINEFMKNKSDLQLVLLEKVIERVIGKIEHGDNYELVKSVADLNGDVSDLFNASSIPDLCGTTSAVLSVLVELNKQINEFPLLFVNYDLTSLQSCREKLFQSSTSKIKHLIDSCKFQVLEIEFRMSLIATKEFSSRIPDSDLHALWNCLVEINGSIERFHCLNCLGFKNGDLLTIQRIGKLPEFSTKFSQFLTELTNVIRKRKGYVLVKHLNQIANELSENNIPEFNQGLAVLQNDHADIYESERRLLHDATFGQISFRVDFALKNRDNNFKDKMVEYDRYLHLLKRVNLLFDGSDIDAYIKHMERTAEESDKSFIQRKILEFRLAFQQYETTLKAVRMTILKRMNLKTRDIEISSISLLEMSEMCFEDRLSRFQNYVNGAELHGILDNLPRVVADINDSCYKLTGELLTKDINILISGCNEEIMLLYLFLRAQTHLFVVDHMQNMYNIEDISLIYSLCVSRRDNESWNLFQKFARQLLLTDRLNTVSAMIQTLDLETYTKEVSLFLKNMKYIEGLQPLFESADVSLVVNEFTLTLNQLELVRLNEAVVLFSKLFDISNKHFVQSLLDFSGDWERIPRQQLTHLTLTEKLLFLETYFSCADLTCLFRETMDKVKYFERMHFNGDLTKLHFSDVVERSMILVMNEVLSFQSYCQIKIYLDGDRNFNVLSEIKNNLDDIVNLQCLELRNKILKEIKQHLLLIPLENITNRIANEFWIPKNEIQEFFDQIDSFRLFETYFNEAIVDEFLSSFSKTVRDSEISKLKSIIIDLTKVYAERIENLRLHQHSIKWIGVKNVSWNGISSPLDRVSLLVPKVTGLEELYDLLVEANLNLKKVQGSFYFTEQGFEVSLTSAINSYQEDLLKELEIIRMSAIIQVFLETDFRKLDYKSSYSDVQHALNSLREMKGSLYQDYCSRLKQAVIDRPIKFLSGIIEEIPSEEKNQSVTQVFSFLQDCAKYPLSWESSEITSELDKLRKKLETFESLRVDRLIESLKNDCKVYSIADACKDPATATKLSSVIRLISQNGHYSSDQSFQLLAEAASCMSSENDLDKIRNLTKLFLEGIDKVNALKVTLYNPSLSEKYADKISWELNEVVRCILSCRISGYISIFSSLPTWTDEDINRLNLELAKLESTSPVKNELRQLIWEQAYNNIEAVINDGPSESYKASLINYFKKLNQLSGIKGGIFRKEEPEMRKNFILELIRERESHRVNQWCIRFEEEFLDLHSNTLVNVQTESPIWIEITKLRLKDVASMNLERFPIVSKLNQLRAYLPDTVKILNLFTGGINFYNDMPLKFYEDRSGPVLEKIISCQETGLATLCRLHAIAKIEKTLASPDVLRTVVAKTKFRLMKQLPHEISKLEQRMSILKNGRVDILFHYQTRLKLLFVNDPIDCINKSLELPINSDYSDLITMGLRFLSIAEIMDGFICFGSNVQGSIAIFRNKVKETEDNLILNWIADYEKQLTVQLMILIQDDGQTELQFDKCRFDDFKRLTFTAKLKRLSCIIETKALEDIFNSISEKEASKNYFVSAEIKPLVLFREKAEAVVELVLSRVKSVKIINYLIRDVHSGSTVKEKDYKFQCIQSEIVSLGDYYKCIEKMKKEMDGKEIPFASVLGDEINKNWHKIQKQKVYSILFETSARKIEELIATIYDFILMKSSASYKDQLTLYIELLNDVDKHLFLKTGIFQSNEVRNVYEQKIKKIEAEEKRGVNSLESQFSNSFSSRFDDFKDRIAELKLNPTLFMDQQWKSRASTCRKLVDDELHNIKRSIENLRLKLINQNLLEPFQNVVTKAVDEYEKTKKIYKSLIEIGKALQKFEGFVMRMKKQIVDHVEKCGIFKFIDSRILTQAILEQNYNLPLSVFKDYNDLLCSCASKEDSALCEHELSIRLERFLTDVLLELMCIILSRISNKSLFIEYQAQLPQLLDFMKRSNITIYQQKLCEVERALSIYQTVNVQKCINSPSGIQIALLVSMFECLQHLQRSLANHIDFSIHVFQSTLNETVENMRIRGQDEAIQGLKATEKVDDFPLPILRTYVNVIHQITEKKLPIQVSSDYTDLIQTMRDTCISAFDGLAHDSSMVEISKRVSRCGWLIAKVFCLLSVLNLEKPIVLALAKELLDKLTPKLKEDVGRVLFSGKDHQHLGTAVNEAIAYIPEFRRLHVELFNAKAQGVSFDEALNDVKSFHHNLLQESQCSSFLQVAVRNLTESYERHLSNFMCCNTSNEMKLINEIYSLANSIKLQETKFSHLKNQKLKKSRPFSYKKSKDLHSKSDRETVKASSEMDTSAHSDILHEEDVKHTVTENFQGDPELHDLIQKFKENPMQANWSFSLVHGEVGHLLGCIFALWAILDANYDVTVRDEMVLLNKMMFKRPHATQVLSILKLLGIDNDTESIKNHLAEVGTGEGKSVSLGILSVFFGLLGFEVNVTCYSKYLSARDHKAFKDLFVTLSIDSRVTYFEINELMAYEMKNSFPNLSQQIRAFLQNNKPNIPAKRNAKSRILLIDEVDVFFSEAYYGNCMSPLLILDDPESKEIIEYVFDNRKELLDYHIFNNSSIGKIKSLECYKSLIKKYPNLIGLIDKQIRIMLKDVALFMKDFIVSDSFPCLDGLIGSVDEHGNRTYHVYDSYKTGFAYLWYKRAGVITENTPGKHTQYGIRITCGSLLYSSLPEHYELVLGLTGSLSCLSAGDKKILEGFNFDWKTYIPSTFNKKTLETEPLMFSDDLKEYYSILLDEIKVKYLNGKPQLIVFESNEKLMEFKKHVHPVGDGVFRFPEVLNEHLSPNDRDNLISRSTSKQTITFMTRAFGRGTDFLCADHDVRAAGGVHVILTFFPLVEAEEVQIKGRTCRQDNNGSFRMILYGGDLRKASFATDYDIRRGISYDRLNERRKQLNENRYQSTLQNLKRTNMRNKSTLVMVNLLDTEDTFDYKRTNQITTILNSLQD